jgi:hypothetical protein
MADKTHKEDLLELFKSILIKKLQLSSILNINIIF